MPQLTETAAWSEVLNHAKRIVPMRLEEHFKHAPRRFDELSLQLHDIFVDVSKQRIVPETLSLLATCLEQQGFAKQRAAMFAGEFVNASEKRPALHAALRSGDVASPHHAEIVAERERALNFAESLRSGSVKGATGKPIKNIIHTGLGGSDLGPQLLVTALADDASPHIIFIRNVDPAPIAAAMRVLDPEETLVCIASKTFTTAETMLNANTLLGWLSKAMGETKAKQHLVALTASPDKAKAYGVAEAHIFRFWEWVGGRFSIWSSIGFPAMAAMGKKRYLEFLSGAEAVDRHFQETPLAQNIPAVLAMLSIWNINVMGLGARAVLPYCEALSEWPSYLQQLEMESLGKSVDRNGRPVPYATAPIVFGMTGTPAQHAFMQAVHQGTHIIPTEILVVKRTDASYSGHNEMLQANALAQAEALLKGKSANEIKKDTTLAPELILQKTFSGNRPTTTIVLEQLSAFALGQLIAIYEHKVFTEAVFWNLNPFDQWGVELGKTLAQPIQNALAMKFGSDGIADNSASTCGLVERLRNF